jgi:rsbT co-antagonist protein RsbR
VTPDDSIAISRERLARIQNLLGALSIGEFDDVHIDVGDDDEFATFEEMVNVFADEYAEAQRMAEQLDKKRVELIERQQAAIADLTVPIIDVWDDVVMLPIVGVVDTQRSVEMTELLLRRIERGGAACVIVDLTGVDVVDTATANHLISMTRAAQLLGSFCVITGLSASIAQTLAQLDVELGAVTTVRNLREGLTMCFRYLDTQHRRLARA